MVHSRAQCLQKLHTLALFWLMAPMYFCKAILVLPAALQNGGHSFTVEDCSQNWKLFIMAAILDLHLITGFLSYLLKSLRSCLSDILSCLCSAANLNILLWLTGIFIYIISLNLYHNAIFLIVRDNLWLEKCIFPIHGKLFCVK